MSVSISSQSLAITLIDGEPLVIDLALNNPDTGEESLTDRRVPLLAYMGEQDLGKITPTIVRRDGRDFLRYVMNGQTTGEWNNLTLSYAVRETLNNTFNTLWDSTITVRPGAPQLDSFASTTTSRRVIRIIRTETNSPDVPVRYEIKYVPEVVASDGTLTPPPAAQSLNFSDPLNSGYAVLF